MKKSGKSKGKNIMKKPEYDLESLIKRFEISHEIFIKNEMEVFYHEPFSLSKALCEMCKEINELKKR